RQQRDLDLGGAGVALAAAIFADQLALSLLGKGHQPLPQKNRAQGVTARRKVAQPRAMPPLSRRPAQTPGNGCPSCLSGQARSRRLPPSRPPYVQYERIKMKKVRGRLSYSNVVATVALFLAIGGATAFAAGKIGKNSVGTKQLKNNAVTTKKIKNQAVTG